MTATLSKLYPVKTACLFFHALSFSNNALPLLVLFILQEDRAVCGALHKALVSLCKLALFFVSVPTALYPQFHPEES